MNNLFIKMKEEPYHIYGFSKKSSEFLIDEWSEYSVDFIQEISELTNNNITEYGRVDFFAYMVLISLFFDPQRSNYLVYRSFYKTNKDRYSINYHITLDLRLETLGDSNKENISLHSICWEENDNLYIKKVFDSQNFFSYDIVEDYSDVSQGLTLIVSNEIVSEKPLVNLMDQKISVIELLDNIDYLVVFERANDLGFINGFYIYSKKDREREIHNIENEFVSRLTKFNYEIKTASGAKEFVRILETFIMGVKRYENFKWQ